MTMSGDTEWITVSEISKRMRVSKMTVWRMVHRGEIPSVRMGRSFRIPTEAFEAFIKSGGSHDQGPTTDSPTPEA